ncbi:MAG: glycosyltransferase family 39 protein [Nocardioides sp.]|uniref:glycosyltransferase family 39 protein n=1 Tax=Nocardioides sp. TaxID=35761 RepID=UPI0039E5515C
MRTRLLRGAYAAAIVALVVPRLHSGTALWLDETLSVDIARLPLPDLVTALRHDGSPPLYYFLLHVWIGLFGTGSLAVRSLSGLFSLTALPLAYAVGGRLGGPRAAAASLLTLAASPFAIRYATETRMYALVLLLSLLGILVGLRALARPTLPRLAALSIVAGLLALTHYWCLFLLVAAEVVLVVGAIRRRGAWTRAALALPLGGAPFVPWVPSFLFQIRHTGAPWAPPASVLDLGATVQAWAGRGAFHIPLLILGLAIAVFAVRVMAGRVLLLTGAGTLLLGLLSSHIQGSAYGLRYSTVALGPALLVVGIGAAQLPRPARWAAGSIAVLLSLAVLTTSSLLGPRTQAAETAALLSTHVAPGDLVVYCPDQLGPAVDRLLPGSVEQVTYPTMASPALIDWTDYAARNQSADPTTYAKTIADETTGRIWLVRADGYLTFGDDCATLDAEFERLRGGRTVIQRANSLREGEWLVGYHSSR